VSSAATLVSSRSQGGTPAGSVVGDELTDQQRSQIALWIPEPTIVEVEDEGLGQSISAGTSSPSPTFVAPTDSNPLTNPAAAIRKKIATLQAKFDNPLTERWLTSGRERFYKKDYAGAEQLLQRMLRSADATYSTYWKGRDKVLKMLAISYCQLELWEEAEQVLGEDFKGKEKEMERLATEFCLQGREDAAKRLLAREFEGKAKVLELYAKRAYWNGKWGESAETLVGLLREADGDNLEELRLMQALAEVKFASGALDEALELCLKVTTGRKNRLGSRHVLFFQSIHLLALIYEAQNDLVEAERYKRLLPDDFKCIILLFNTN